MFKKYIFTVFIIIQLLFLQLISNFPNFVEFYYSNGFYVKISVVLRTILGRIPFSVGDCVYFLVGFLIFRWFYKQYKSRKLNWKDSAFRVVGFLSVFYFLFNLFWALNYHREPLFKKMNIERKYSSQDLLLFTNRLIAKINEIHSKIQKNKDCKVVFPYSQEQVFEMNLEGYQMLSTQFSSFEYHHPSIKKSLFSLPLSYMGFGGYLNPFTNEAQVNDKIPMYNFPTTVCHEMAHQLGYASESEANFIGFLASVKNDNIYFQYSGYSYALRYCLGNWRVRDKKVFDELLKTIRPGILKNYKESDVFWRKYETFVEIGFQVFYDNFLKLNQQKDGLEGYSKFVDLMVNYYREESF